MWITICGILVAAATDRRHQREPAGAETNRRLWERPAPDFTLNSQEGKPISLHEFKGKWVVLYFYPKDMTTGCTIEAHNFQRGPG